MYRSTDRLGIGSMDLTLGDFNPTDRRFSISARHRNPPCNIVPLIRIIVAKFPITLPLSTTTAVTIEFRQVPTIQYKLDYIL